MPRGHVVLLARYSEPFHAGFTRLAGTGGVRWLKVRAGNRGVAADDEILVESGCAWCSPPSALPRSVCGEHICCLSPSGYSGCAPRSLLTRAGATQEANCAAYGKMLACTDISAITAAPISAKARYFGQPHQCLPMLADSLGIRAVQLSDLLVEQLQPMQIKREQLPVYGLEGSTQSIHQLLVATMQTITAKAANFFGSISRSAKARKMRSPLIPSRSLNTLDSLIRISFSRLFSWLCSRTRSRANWTLARVIMRQARCSGWGTKLSIRSSASSRRTSRYASLKSGLRPRGARLEYA